MCVYCYINKNSSMHQQVEETLCGIKTWKEIKWPQRWALSLPRWESDTTKKVARAYGVICSPHVSLVLCLALVRVCTRKYLHCHIASPADDDRIRHHRDVMLLQVLLVLLLLLVDRVEIRHRAAKKSTAAAEESSLTTSLFFVRTCVRTDNSVRVYAPPLPPPVVKLARSTTRDALACALLAHIPAATSFRHVVTLAPSSRLTQTTLISADTLG